MGEVIELLPHRIERGVQWFVFLEYQVAGKSVSALRAGVARLQVCSGKCGVFHLEPHQRERIVRNIDLTQLDHTSIGDAIGEHAGILMDGFRVIEDFS